VRNEDLVGVVGFVLLESGAEDDGKRSRGWGRCVGLGRRSWDNDHRSSNGALGDSVAEADASVGQEGNVGSHFE
jgi:hypothetical protein